MSKPIDLEKLQKLPPITDAELQRVQHIYEPLGPMPPAAAKRWQHDCDECVWRGSLVVEDEHIDFYTCNKAPGPPRYVGRTGDGGPDYTSFDQDTVLLMGTRTDQHWVINVLWHHAILDSSEWRNEDFAIYDGGPGLGISIIGNPCIDPRRIRYIEDAAKVVCPTYLYGPMHPAVLHQMLLEIQAEVRVQENQRR